MEIAEVIQAYREIQDLENERDGYRAEMKRLDKEIDARHVQLRADLFSTQTTMELVTQE